jgi:topoisomerase-4 subunit A
MQGVSFKDGDERFFEVECKTTEQLMLLGHSGKAYTLAVASLPGGRGDGVPVNTLIGSESDEIAWIGAGEPDALHLLSTTAGTGFICKLSDMVARLKAGKEFVSVPEGARMRPALPLWRESSPPKDAARRYLAALSSDTRLLLFPLNEVPSRPNGGLGVTLIALPEKVSLAGLAVSDGASLTVIGERRGKAVREELSADELKEHLGKRAQRGRVVPVRYKVFGIGESAQPS